jgi:hypothetical protein
VVWAFYEKYSLILAIVLMVMGLYMNFFGAYFKFAIIFIIGIIAWLIIGMIVIFSIFASLTGNITDIEMVIVLSVSAFLGILYGVLMYKFESVFNITCGAIFGLVLGQFVYNIVFSFFASLPVYQK